MVDTISNIDSGSYSSASSNSFTITPSSTLSENDCIVVCVRMNDSSIFDIYTSIPDGFEWVDQILDQSVFRIDVFAKVCGDSEPASYTFNYSSNYSIAATWSVYDNVSSAIGIKSKRSNGGSNHTLAATIGAGQMAVMCWGAGGTLSSSSGDYTEDVLLSESDRASAIVSRLSTGAHQGDDYSHSYTAGASGDTYSMGTILTPTGWTSTPYLVYRDYKNALTEQDIDDEVIFDVPDNIQDMMLLF